MVPLLTGMLSTTFCLLLWLHHLWTTWYFYQLVLGTCYRYQYLVLQTCAWYQVPGTVLTSICKPNIVNMNRSTAGICNAEKSSSVADINDDLDISVNNIQVESKTHDRTWVSTNCGGWVAFHLQGKIPLNIILRAVHKRIYRCYWRLPSHNQPPNFSWKWQQPQFIISGHYMTCGVNIQTFCDADSWYNHFGVVALEKCSDQVASVQTSIFDRVAAFDRSWRCSIIYIEWCYTRSLCWLTTWWSNTGCI